jgi:hypothetical protein
LRKEFEDLKKEKENAKKKRKEERAAARERFRIQKLLEKIQNTLIVNSTLEEFNP